MKFDELSHCVIGCGIEVHRELGPGLLESAYELCTLILLRDLRALRGEKKDEITKRKRIRSSAQRCFIGATLSK